MDVGYVIKNCSDKVDRKKCKRSCPKPVSKLSVRPPVGTETMVGYDGVQKLEVKIKVERKRLEEVAN
jgi:hypothetical protein